MAFFLIKKDWPFTVLRSLLPGNAQVVEIGSWKGKSTYCLARGLRSGKIWAIDPFNAAGKPGSDGTYASQKGSMPLLEQFRRNLARHGLLSKVNTLQGVSADFVGRMPAIDLWFIDGDHSLDACRFDYET